MQQTNDHVLTIPVENQKPLVIKKFDTPLQIAHRFCCDNQVELRYCKKISQSIIGLMKTYIDQFPQLKQFRKYFGDQLLYEKKAFYSIDEILENANKENTGSNFSNEDQEYQHNSIPLLDIYKSPKDGISQIGSNEQMNKQKLEDMSKKLYQNILSPTPEDPQTILQSQTTKNVSALSRQLQKNQFINHQILRQKSQEKIFQKNSEASFNTTTTKLKQYHPLFSSESRKENQILQQVQQKAQSNKNQLSSQVKKRQQSNSRTSSNSKTRCKTEVNGNDSLFQIANIIFNWLDQDKDGYISPQQIDISSIPDDILKQKYQNISQLFDWNATGDRPQQNEIEQQIIL